ncbi:MAG TPA: hypothetical protein ENJ55_06930, partial [Rhizobiales bacterium]|nr:hypothetical protein [Hyphomicrobiales bacterium]
MSAWDDLLQLASPARKTFLSGLNLPEKIQWNVLSRILGDNAQTTFGLQHGFASIQSVDAFRHQVPVAQYEDLRADIIAMTKGEKNVLTREEPLAYDLTSGSTGAAKIIPYTASGLENVRVALMVWLADILETYPQIAHGRFYWALSPAAREMQQLPGGALLGPVQDSVFFGEEAVTALSALSVVPPELALESDIETWRTETLCHLLAAGDLTFISIWSPTFLTALLEHFVQEPEAVIQALHDGISGCRANPYRARTIQSMMETTGLDTTVIWPHLAAISTWADAGAKRFVPDLANLFPHAAIQGKGLMSTEALTSIPISAAQYPVLATASAFFEFLDDDGNSWLAHEVVPGCKYRVIITTSGGLFRYDTTDIVRIHAPMERTPTLEFIGRAGEVSDMCGEKLSGQSVIEALEPLSCFAFLAPLVKQFPHYALVMDADMVDAAQAAK